MTQIGRRASGAAVGGQTIPWTSDEERLLCAIVHEFGSNWYLVADVLAASCSMQGIYRSPYNCRQKFRAITVRAKQSPESEYARLDFPTPQSFNVPRQHLVWEAVRCVGH